MDRDALKGLVEAFYTARTSNDALRVRQLFADHCVVSLQGEAPDPTLRTAGPSTDDVTIFIELLVRVWKWHSVDMHRMVIDGDQVATHYTLDVTHIPSGERISTQLCDHFDFEGGKISSFTEFVDTGLVARLSEQTN